MKIVSVSVNNRKKSICIETRKGMFEYPFAKLDVRPTARNRIKDIFVEAELGREAVTYFLESGSENSLHLDAFLEYNRDPDYLKMLFLYELSVKAQKALKKSKLLKGGSKKIISNFFLFFFKKEFTSRLKQTDLFSM